MSTVKDVLDEDIKQFAIESLEKCWMKGSTRVWMNVAQEVNRQFPLNSSVAKNTLMRSTVTSYFVNNFLLFFIKICSKTQENDCHFFKSTSIDNTKGETNHSYDGCMRTLDHLIFLPTRRIKHHQMVIWNHLIIRSHQMVN